MLCKKYTHPKQKRQEVISSFQNNDPIAENALVKADMGYTEKCILQNQTLMIKSSHCSCMQQ